MELGKEGAVGLITYMRTDSTRVSDDALTEVREYIGERYGNEYLPEAPNVYKRRRMRRTRTKPSVRRPCCVLPRSSRSIWPKTS